MSLVDLRKDWVDCERCDLCTERSRVVFGEGNPNADVLIIGEAPGEVEDATGLPFQGDAGSVLDDFLTTTGLNREEDIFLTNTVGCRPTIESRDDRTGDMFLENRQPNKKEREACWERLAEIVYQVDPLLILAVGKVPAAALLGRVSTMQKMRGRIFRASLPGRQTDISYPVLVIFHTAYLLRIHDHRVEGPWGKTLEDFYTACDVIDHLREAYHGIPVPDRRRSNG